MQKLNWEHNHIHEMELWEKYYSHHEVESYGRRVYLLEYYIVFTFWKNNNNNNNIINSNSKNPKLEEFFEVWNLGNQ